jgi:hypothetical protein
MSINYATQYSSLVDEAFAKESFTQQATNQDYDWNGVQSVVVYGYGTVKQGDYTNSGSSRYGTAADLDNSTQTMTVGMDRAFTFVIDRKAFNDTQMTAEVGTAVARQLRMQTIPERDKYNCAKMIASAPQSATAAITSSNAFTSLLDGRAKLVNAKVPMSTVICFCSTGFYSAIMTDDKFIKRGDMSQEITLKGVVGIAAGIPIIEVPDEYLFGAEFLLCSPLATTAPQKIEEIKIHDNPPGINGWLVEGRFNYDAFVRDNKKDALYVHKGVLDLSLSAGTSTTTTKALTTIDAEISGKAGLSLVYKGDIAAAADAVAIGADVSAWTAYPNTNLLTTASQKYVQIALKDSDGKAFEVSGAKLAVVGS